MIATGAAESEGAAPINIWISTSRRKNCVTAFIAARSFDGTVSTHYYIPAKISPTIIEVYLEWSNRLFCITSPLLCLDRFLDGALIPFVCLSHVSKLRFGVSRLDLVL